MDDRRRGASRGTELGLQADSPLNLYRRGEPMPAKTVVGGIAAGQDSIR